MKACATNTSDTRGNHNRDREEAVNAKRSHSSDRMLPGGLVLNPTMRIRCPSTMQRVQGTLSGRGTRETQATDKRGI